MAWKWFKARGSEKEGRKKKEGRRRKEEEGRKNCDFKASLASQAKAWIQAGASTEAKTCFFSRCIMG